jgi:hypothetical protein
MKTYGGVDVQIHVFFTSALAGGWVVSFTPWPPYSRGKSPRYPLYRLGGLQSRSGRRGEKSWLHRDSNSDPSVVQPVASRLNEYQLLKNRIYMELGPSWEAKSYLPSQKNYPQFM